MYFSKLAQQLEKSGNLSEKQVNEVRKAAAYLEKHAAKGGIADYFRAVAPHLITILGATAVTGALGYHAASKRQKELQGSIRSSFNTINASHPDLAKKPDLLAQRFHELSLISPSVASNPEFAHKVIRPRMGKGFDLDDIHRLSAIEHHTHAAPRPAHPSSVVGAEAMSGLREMINLLGPSVVTHAMQPRLEAALKSGVKAQSKAEVMQHANLKASQHEAQTFRNLFERAWPHVAKTMSGEEQRRFLTESFAGAAADAREKILGKTSSANAYLSEEAVGRMIADRYCMYKEAGIFTGLGQYLKGAIGESGQAMKAHFKTIAIPLALGMGWQVMRQILKQRETSQLHNQADKVYGTLMRKSDVMKANPQLAAEAFDSLKSFAPSLAVKPVVARTFVEHVVDRGVLGPEAAQQLASTEEKVRQLNELGSGGFLAGLKQPIEVFKFGYPPKGVDYQRSKSKRG